MIDTLTIIQTHGYWILFIFLLIEGSATTYVAAFTASLGLFNIYFVFLLSAFGSIISDSFVFWIGKISRKNVVYRIIKHFEVSKTRINKIKLHLKHHLGKTLAVIKITPFIPVPGVLSAGIANIKFKRFFFYSALISTIYSMIFSITGFYSGLAFNSILKYMTYGARTVLFLILLIVIWFVLEGVLRKIVSKFEKI